MKNETPVKDMNENPVVSDNVDTALSDSSGKKPAKTLVTLKDRAELNKRLAELDP